VIEPPPPDPAPPRYTSGPFPAYRFIPGRSPHPRCDRRGHSWGLPEPRIEPLDPAAWASCATYLRGVDLFNFAYWWESHEAFEALWRGSRAGSPPAALLQGLIQLAASEIKRFSEMPSAATKLGTRALELLGGVPSPYCGLDVRALAGDVEQRLAGTRREPLILVLR
jgi:predicted metal-dependent hydrolase